MYNLKILLMSFHDWQHDFNRVCIFKDLIWSDVQPDIWKKNITACICCMFMISLCDQVGDLDLSLHHEVDTPAKLKNRVSSKNWGVCITKAKKKALSNKRNDRCKLLMKAVGLSALWQADTHSYRGHSECDWWSLTLLRKSLLITFWGEKTQKKNSNPDNTKCGKSFSIPHEFKALNCSAHTEPIKSYIKEPVL